MSLDVLIEDLRHKSSDRIRQIREMAEGRAGELRRLKNEERERLRDEMQGQLKGLEESAAAPILHEAERGALAIEDEALGRLSERLSMLAGGLLGQVREEEYEALFAGLVDEMPAVSWEMVQVNPRDAGLAESFFPGAAVEADPSITGGFVASADSGRYRVVNTLEGRLEKAWPVILPLLMRKITKEKDASSSG